MSIEKSPTPLFFSLSHRPPCQHHFRAGCSEEQPVFVWPPLSKIGCRYPLQVPIFGNPPDIRSGKQERRPVRSATGAAERVSVFTLVVTGTHLAESDQLFHDIGRRIAANCPVGLKRGWSDR
jgi:hypothetical protein